MAVGEDGKANGQADPVMPVTAYLLVEADGESADPRAVLRTVDRALRVLETFAGPQREWSYADPTRATGIHKTILYRLLATLEARAFVERDPAPEPIASASACAGWRAVKTLVCHVRAQAGLEPPP